MAPLIITMLLMAAITTTHGLVGYDCRGDGLNITTLSLTEIGECQWGDIEPKNEEVYIQLLQLSEFNHVMGLQCKIEIDRQIYYCGMHSHISAVHNGKREYLYDISSDACRILHSTGAINIGGKEGLITGIKVNTTTMRSITMAGKIGVNGRCDGTQYSDEYGTWDNVIVQATVKITIRQVQMAVKHSSSEVMLPLGARCQVTRGECPDADGTPTFWRVIATDSCQFDRYDVLYQGKAHKLTPREDHTNTPVIYTATSKDTTFALARTTETNLCGYRIWQTEHPKLFIFETEPGKTFKGPARTTVDNLDIFAYVNSKFIYVEKHMRTQLTRLYRDIITQKCTLERQILVNALSLAGIAPDEMAYRIMKSPGYTAMTAGEIIYIIKCVPVLCRVRHVENCYIELPVTYRNESYFLLPRSRILTKTGSTKECNTLLPSTYQVDGRWFKFTPHPTEATPPPVIQPLTQPKWKYVSPGNLATSGIYSAEDIDRLRDHIMFPVERPSILNTIAQGAAGQQIPHGAISLQNFLDEDTLVKIAEGMGARMWNKFMSFGSASAGILAILIIIKFLKLIIDSVIRGYALHSIYGWSTHLLGAIWSSLTHLLIQLGRKKERSMRQNDPEAPIEKTTPMTPPQVYPSKNNCKSATECIPI